jgi:hypothetical protein
MIYLYRNYFELKEIILKLKKLKTEKNLISSENNLNIDHTNEIKIKNNSRTNGIN